MGAVSKYWIRVRIDSFGKCQTTELPDIRAFVQQEFSQLIKSGDIPDREIQRLLMQWWQNKDTRSQTAEACLRCFVSNQIKDICLQLEIKFGKTHDVTSDELFPYVLDSTREIKITSTLTTRILQTFDADKSNLSTWTIRIFKSDPVVKRFLLEHGIEQVTDWMLLNYVTPGRLEKILVNWRYTQAQIQREQQLLDSYHRVYRTQLLQNRKAGVRSTYPQPTVKQLFQIAKDILPWQLTPETVLEKLQDLARLLRQERIRKKTGSTSAETYYNDKISSLDKNENQNEDEDNSKFLIYYSQQFNVCLENAIKHVIGARIIYLQGNKTTKSLKKAENFIQALHLFHCQGVPMKEIFPRLDLIDQPAVSRLLELKNLRSDIGRNSLLCLQNYILEITRSRVSPNQLKDLETKVQVILNEEIQTLIKEAEQEASNGQKRVMNSQLAQKVCKYLDGR